MIVLALLCVRRSQLILCRVVGAGRDGKGIFYVSRGKRKRKEGRSTFNLYLEGGGGDDEQGEDGMAIIGRVGSDRCGLSSPPATYPDGGSMDIILTDLPNLKLLLLNASSIKKSPPSSTIL